MCVRLLLPLFQEHSVVDLSEDDQIQAAIKASLEEPRKSVTYISDSDDDNSDDDDVETFSDTDNDSQSSPVKNSHSKNDSKIAVCSNSSGPSCSSKTETTESNENCKKCESNVIENGVSNSSSNSITESYKKYIGKESGIYRFAFVLNLVSFYLCKAFKKKRYHVHCTIGVLYVRLSAGETVI